MITKLYEDAKNIKEVLTFLNNAHNALSDAEKKFEKADLLNTIMELNNHIRKQDTLIESLEKDLKNKGDLIYEKPYFYRKGDEEKLNPICAFCYQTEQLEIYLNSITQGKWHCKKCIQSFKDKSYTHPQTMAKSVKMKNKPSKFDFY